MVLEGYSDRWSYAPGEVVPVRVSSSTARYTWRVRALAPAEDDSEPFDTILHGAASGRLQAIRTGSFVLALASGQLAQLQSFTLACWVFATTPRLGRRQGLLGWAGTDQPSAGLAIDPGGRLTLEPWPGLIGSSALNADSDLPDHTWCFIAATFDSGTSTGAIYQGHQPTPRIRRAVELRCVGEMRMPAVLPPGAPELFLMAAGLCHGMPGSPWALDLYNGKLGCPRVFDRALTRTELGQIMEGEAIGDVVGEALVAAWDFAESPHDVVIPDRSGNGFDARTYNRPMRAVTGHLWDGTQLHFKDAPDQWSAIHFHDDDLEDSGWEADTEIKLPNDLAPGPYAIELRADGRQFNVPLLITPKAGSARAEVAFLVPTLSYLAYANHTPSAGDEDLSPEPMTPSIQDRYIEEHPGLGLCVYQLHSDTSGACFSTRLRPVYSMDPDYTMWVTGAPRGYSADLLLLRWLAKEKIAYDLVTDDQVHEQGQDLLESYRVVLTGSHPEYVTESILNALEGYVNDRGSLMYLGGNGFYWVTSIDPLAPYIIEVRRGWAGSRNWESRPGELYHATTGEPGGLWRHRGRPAQAIVGVGSSAIGFGGAAAYELQPESSNQEVSFVFDGLRTQTIGAFQSTFGQATSGAAGDEMDRRDFRLGSPLGTLLLASSVGRHSEYYKPFVEDVPYFTTNESGAFVDKVRADMTYVEHEGGGRVFSVGSINWILAMSHRNYENDVAHVTRNVLRHFLAG